MSDLVGNLKDRFSCVAARHVLPLHPTQMDSGIAYLFYKQFCFKTEIVGSLLVAETIEICFAVLTKSVVK